MNDTRIRIRANRSTGELEIEGPPQIVTEWWDKVWPELSAASQASSTSAPQGQRQTLLPIPNTEQNPDIFGEFFTEFRSDISDVDKVLIAGAFVQGKEPDRTFSTKASNQLLLDQNIKVANASENVRRLLQTKKVFIVSDGRFRVSASGLEHLKSLRGVQ